MQPEFSHLDGEEQIKAENDFLKMKLMLEHGGEFISCGDEPIPGEIENDFLNSIIEFEKHFEQRRVICVFDKIGQPGHFRPAGEVPDDEIGEAWSELNELLNQNDIALGVCRPNVTVRELYRFVTEELFNHEVDDMDMPGWISHFIYDEFYPDPVYENSRLAETDLLGDIFKTGELFSEINYDGDGFTFNGEYFESFATFAERINRFKSFYSDIGLANCEVETCVLDGSNCVVKGNYKAIADNAAGSDVFEGKFEVELILKEFFNFWYFKNISIEGLQI